MDKEKTPEELIDQCWKMLYRKYEEVYGKGYRGKPQFRIVLSHDEIHMLKCHVANLPFSEQVFIGIDKNMMFGHELQEQRKTPYIEAIIG